MRRPPHGGRRMERALFEMRGAVAIECVSERISEQLFARAAQTRVRKRIPLAPRRAFCKTRAPCVDHHM
eukprot:3578071-Lingulodinium_polyedra.AAC.1